MTDLDTGITSIRPKYTTSPQPKRSSAFIAEQSSTLHPVEQTNPAQKTLRLQGTYLVIKDEGLFVYRVLDGSLRPSGDCSFKRCWWLAVALEDRYDSAGLRGYVQPNPFDTRSVFNH